LDRKCCDSEMVGPVAQLLEASSVSHNEMRGEAGAGMEPREPSDMDEAPKG